MFDLNHPFFRPRWIRIAVTVFIFAWALLEFATGALFWGVLFGALGVWCWWQFFGPNSKFDRGR